MNPVSDELNVAAPPEERLGRRGPDSSRWIMLSWLLLCLGVFGLPVLWRSRAFSRPAKLAWSVVVVVETVIWWVGLVVCVRLLMDGVRWIATLLADTGR